MLSITHLSTSINSGTNTSVSDRSGSGLWSSSGWTRGREVFLMLVSDPRRSALWKESCSSCLITHVFNSFLSHRMLVAPLYLELVIWCCPPVLPPTPQSPPDHYFTVSRVVLMQHCRTWKSFFLWKINKSVQKYSNCWCLTLFWPPDLPGQ